MFPVTYIGITGLPSGGLKSSYIVFVAHKSDLPTSIGGVITLKANVTYFITANVDLTGDRLIVSQNTTIIGGSSENCSLTSTGLANNIPLITIDFTCPIRHISIKNVHTAIQVNGVVNAPVALDWTGVNFQNVPNIGEINTCDNWIYSKGAFLNSNNLNFTGTIGTMGSDNSLFQGDGNAGDIISVDENAVITRRIRIESSSFVVFGSTGGINVSDLATFDPESFILDVVNFSGGSTYLTGIDHLSNKALFRECVGIVNSNQISQIEMINNVTPTVITAVNTPVKLAGTTTPSVINQKFNNDISNRSVYTGAITRIFKLLSVVSVESGNTNQVSGYHYKNGVQISGSKSKITTNGSGRAESLVIQSIVELSEGDYIETFGENNSAIQNITATELNTIIQ